MNLRNSFFITLITACAATAQAAVPSGYYKNAEGKTGQALLQALNGIVGNPSVKSYDGLWEVYKTSDLTEDGKGIWDMYSTKVWGAGKEQCGNYKNVGDCYNREHSFPKSWFGKASPMVSDAFHVVPTDGKVNSQRSNYPYGECAGGTNLGTYNGVKALGRCGTSTFTGYSGRVFEPDDQYKGDFARTYFYMAAAYYSRIGSWSSDMLAKNSYPAYKSWAINLLLKWHRQDEVSKKETTRNDAVYAKQHNRNPFIDHPELVEYIWGNSVGTPWYPGGKTDPVISAPASGSSVNIGNASVGATKQVTIQVKGAGLTENVTASVDNSSFKVSPATISASSANNGTSLNISFTAAAAGSYSANLTLVSGNLRSTVKLTANAINGLVAEEATSVTDGSFVARWVNISGDNARYDLYVERQGAILNGYPVTVDAKDEFRRIDGLEAETTYVYYLASGNLISNRVSVTTAAPIPMIQILYDGDLSLTSIVGTPTEPVEIPFETENITQDITLTVSEPFQVSTDRTNWSTTLKLSTEEDRFYLRLNAAKAGSYSTELEMQAGSYIYDDVEFEGTSIERPADFIETFETPDGFKENYTNGNYTGTAAVWYCNITGVYKADAEKALNGSLSARFGKNATSSITMNEDKPLGIGECSFKTQIWPNDAEATVETEYSTDGGTTWKSAGSAKATSAVETHRFTVNVPGNARIRLRQTAGSRLLVDDIALSNYSSSVAVTTDDNHSWDAYAVGSTLVIENKAGERSFEVYAVDGTTVLSRTISAATYTRTLTPGLYIVVSGDFARKVLVK